MYNVLKLAALSAALAAAAVTLLDGPRNQPSAAKFLTDRLKAEVVPAPAAASMTGGGVIVPAANACGEAAWPYRGSCAAPRTAADVRAVRVISPDRREVGRVAQDALHAQIAQR